MDFALPVAFAIAAWWLSTVVLIYRAGLPKSSFAATLAGTSAVMLFGACVLFVSRDTVSAAGAYVAFLGALAVWGWHEVSYLFGFISGPRPEPCPPNCRGWRRFVLGVKTCVYHELAIVATVVAMAAMLWNSPNRVGLWAFVILWLMRWSAKLNIFLGVRNLHEEFWPEHLHYLKSFVRRRAMNELFPVSIILASAGLAVLIFIAIAAADDVARRTGATLLATLLALATLEHCLLVLRISDDSLWAPGMRSRQDREVEAG
jgi:putative photosynthetic complex assembly protein 2